ncbi:MAG: hypothetical protein M3R52_09555 [Acidobacteriota bacterium]|nr:hypothetical protein [Acidobacteriota bacterium]
MPTVSEWWNGVWDKIQHDPAILPTYYPILGSNSDKDKGESFKGESHYFTVRVNRIFLQYGRQFWNNVVPMALVVSEFKYKGENTVVPFVVGESLLQNGKINIPASFLFANTKVAGTHPYKGGGLKLTVILYQVQRTNLVTNLLDVVEKFTSVLDFSQALSSYLKIASVVVDIVDGLIHQQGTQPLIGLRQEFDAGDGFGPGYFALIDSRNIQVPQNKLWVRNDDLHFGDSAETAKEFRQANYILYRIQQARTRDDAEQLSPIYELWQKVKTEATDTRPDNWEITKAVMSTLYQQMVTSPDLTEDHANQLNDDFVARMERIHDRAVGNVKQGREAEPAALSRSKRKALDILKM